MHRGRSSRDRVDRKPGGRHECCRCANTLEKPEVTVEVQSDFVVFDWDQAGAESWGVAVVNGSCGIVDPAAPTIVASIATCTPDDGATGPLCLSVKGFNAAGDSSSFSNWRCSDTDAFGIDDAVAGYAPGTYAAGRVGFGTSTPVMASTASPTNCIVDLSFLPYRYLCLAGETELETGISGLRSLAEAQERVFWVGEIDDTVVQDFDPPEQPTRAAKAKRAQARNLLEVCMTRLSIGTTMVAR